MEGRLKCRPRLDICSLGHKSNRRFYGTGCVINEQVILQDQEGVLSWVSERLAVAMRQAED